MAWKKEYQDARRIKAKNDEAYRLKRNAQSIGKSRERYDKYHDEYYRKNKSKWDDSRKRRRKSIMESKRNKYHTDPEFRRRAIEKAKQWTVNNPDKRKDTNLKKNYGITLDQFNSLLKRQNGVCAICGMKSEKKLIFPVVDHCHKTNVVRGILCALCNKAIGLFKDDVSRMRKAIEYLERSIQCQK